MKKILLLASLLFCARAEAAAVNLYFDSTVSNYSTCSEGTPCSDLAGTTYDTNGVDCGSTINYKRGNGTTTGVWEGSEAEVIARASSATSCAANPIYVQAYGSGTNPILFGSAITSTGWSAYAGRVSVTVDASTNIITYSSHALGAGDEIRFDGTSLPGGISANTTYYVRRVDGSNAGDPVTSTGFRVTATRYGSVVDITSNGTAVTVYTPGIYVQSATQSGTVKTVAYLDNGTHKGLGWWAGNAATLQEGTFKEVSDVLYVRLEGNLDPATSSVRIGSYQHNSNNGDRGLLRTTNDETRAIGIRFRDITIVGANGVAFSSSGANTEDLGLEIHAAARDSHLFYAELAGSLENASSSWSYRLKTSYGSSGAGQYNSGQPITNYGGAYNGYTHFKSWMGRMAGVDNLHFGANSNAIQTTYLSGYTCNNGRSRSAPSFDSSLYFDGPHDVFAWDIDVCGAGQGYGLAGGARGGVTIGSEHPTTLPAYNIWLWNSRIYDNHYISLLVDNTTSSSLTNKAMDFRFNTVIAAGTSSTNFDYAMWFNDLDTSVTDNISFYHNLVIGDNGNVIAPMPNVSRYVGNRNVFHKRGASSGSTIFSGTATTWASWQSAASPDDANSVHTTTLPITTDSDAQGETPDTLLPDGSAAIDIGGPVAVTYPSWLQQNIKDAIGLYGTCGTTRASGVVDDVGTNPDAGHHDCYFPYTNTSVTSTSYSENTNGSLTLSFTIPQYLGEIIYTDKFTITLPSGFTINSGGTSAATSSTISGTWNACSVNGQAITCQRAGDAQSEFYGAHNITISNIGMGSARTTGTFRIDQYDTDDEKFMEGTSIPGITITASAASSGTFTFSGQTMTCTATCVFS